MKTKLILFFAIAIGLFGCGKNSVIPSAPRLAPVQGAAKPVNCEVYDLGYYPSALPVFENLSPSVTIGLNRFTLGTASGTATAFPALVHTAAEAYASRVAFRCKGSLNISQSGVNVIKVVSDDGVRVTLGGLKIIENNTSHAAVTNSATVTLDAGSYQMTVEYFQGDGDKQLTVTAQGPAATL